VYVASDVSADAALHCKRVSFCIVCRAEYDENVLHRFAVALVNITGQRLDIDLRRLHVQKDTTQSEVSREVANQLATFDNSGPAVPGAVSPRVLQRSQKSVNRGF